ncbi:hypothetical protein RUND412_003846 [Rhizina undulata]
MNIGTWAEIGQPLRQLDIFGDTFDTIKSSYFLMKPSTSPYETKLREWKKVLVRTEKELKQRNIIPESEFLDGKSSGQVGSRDQEDADTVSVPVIYDSTDPNGNLCSKGMLQEYTTAIKDVITELTLNEKQSRQTFCLFIAGKGGVGKSRVIHGIERLFKRLHCSHILELTGASGAAADNINGVTIHSSIGLPIFGMGLADDKERDGTRVNWSQMQLRGLIRSVWYWMKYP